MQQRACTDMRNGELIADAGHWLEQEQPAVVVDRLLVFLAGQGSAGSAKN